MNYNTLNRRQRARLGRNEWIHYHAAVQSEMQDRIRELTGQIIDLRAQVQQLDSEVLRKVKNLFMSLEYLLLQDSIIRGQAHRIGSLHDELFNVAVRPKNGHDCHASTQTAAPASYDAFAQTVTAESCDASAQTATAEGCDASAQTATAERCDASTQTATAESCHALTQTDDIPDDVTENAQVELTRQLTDAQSKIEMLEKARADVMPFARGTINSAKEEQREMMDHIKKDYDEKIAQRDAVITKLETHIQSLKRVS
ncbi:hypothetical protein FOL46_004103 [Perkinsus olseni]|uniref:Uncharacterized protein n=1 Tax=Perkinsus olseni TaxID=32597 RepID=A0A7J6M0R2_PEROL|nr:hypothetical protein FOL46_004103 [Perkinsus olseni]